MHRHLLVGKSYADPADIMADEATLQAFHEAESLYCKSEDVDSGLNANPIVGSSILLTHAEDAGLVHEVLPPMYNPKWNNSSVERVKWSGCEG